MKLGGPQVVTQLREKLHFAVGRHLYGVLGTYAGLHAFERDALAQALLPDGTPFPAPVNLNAALLASIGDADLRQMVQDEARRPQAVQNRLNQALNGLLGTLLAERDFIILKQLELLFAYSLDLSVFRTRASNQSHILLLLPGARQGEQVVLFREADARFHRVLIPNLIADNHLWELAEERLKAEG